MPHVLALDQGTTSSRAIVFDEQGNIITTAQREFSQSFPRPGWVEHDPLEIWSSQREVMLEAVERANLKAVDIACIGIANQRETTVVWDRQTGQPIYPAIVWQDRRTAARCESLMAHGFATTIRQKSGLVIDAYFSGTKIQWILDHVAGARQRAMAGALAFGTVDSWLVWNLTGGQVHVTDASNASRTMLLDIHKGCWDDELLEILRVPRELLPQVRGSSEVIAHVLDPSPLAGVPIAGMAGDQQAALFGQQCNRPGMIKNTYGTGCFILMHTGDRAVASSHHLLTTIAWKLGDKIEYALEGSVFVAGALVQWLRDGLEMFESAEQIELLAASVTDNGGVFFVPALAGLGAPHWDPYARGSVFGLTRGTQKGHLARAALEGIAFQVADVLQAMQADADMQLGELRVDGGVAANNLLLQFQADLLNVPVVRSRVLETTALGAAYLAGLAVGIWQDPKELAWQASGGDSFVPKMTAAEAESLHRGWKKALTRSRSWVEPEQA